MIKNSHLTTTGRGPGSTILFLLLPLFLFTGCRNGDNDGGEGGNLQEETPGTLLPPAAVPSLPDNGDTPVLPLPVPVLPDADPPPPAADPETTGEDGEEPVTAAPAEPGPIDPYCPESQLPSGFYVVGGEEASDRDDISSSTVALVSRGSRGRKLSLCTGTLIGPHHLVTAAHCLFDPDSGDSLFRPHRPNDPENITIGFGNPTGGRATPDSFSITRQVAALMVHKKFSLNGNGAGRFHDIGVITFSGGIPAGFRAVLVAPPRPVEGPVIAAGFGKTSHDDESEPGLTMLRMVEMELENEYEEFRELDLKLNTGRGVCHGDSGGPLYLPSPSGACLTVAGAASRLPREPGQAHCDKGGGVYTDVRRYQGLMKCWFDRMERPLDYLSDDETVDEC